MSRAGVGQECVHGAALRGDAAARHGGRRRFQLGEGARFHAPDLALTLNKVDVDSANPLCSPLDSSDVRLDELTSAEFAQKIGPDAVVLLPVGALEEHGPHLPLGADMMQPMHAIEAVARRTGAYIAPPIPYGVVPTTRPYPGTVGVGFDSLRAFVRDVLLDLERNGVRRVLIVSGHAASEHMAALRVAAKEVVDRGAMRITVLSDYDIIYDWKDLPPNEGHAGMLETSRILAQRPELVKGTAPAGRNEIPRHAILADARPYWPGVTGDPSKATRELGEQLDGMVIEELVRLVDELKGRS